MKKLLIFALLATLVHACSQSSSENGADKNASEPTAAAPAADGEKIYKTYCVTCHGLYGDMGASGAFNLQTSALPLEERINVITNGRKVMTPFKELLSEEKIKAVAEYTMTLKK
jgi:mono/diheme cytochrome c family protein